VLALIPLFPLLGFAVNAALGRRLPKPVAGGLASLAMLGSFAVSAWSVWRLAAIATPADRVVEQVLFTWIASDDLDIPLAFRLDPLSAVMILVVTGIGSLIHIYSIAYMREETAPEFARYFSYLNLFAAFMLVLVLGSNFPILFIGWEGVGLCSYLLIGFWYRKKSASDAGKKAFVINRIGDYAFILGMLTLFAQFGTLDFRAIAEAVTATPPEAGFGILSVATLLLFIGATGKSAQIPLYTWLPDAMEGPTPVSALIHAATMVTAGVYMIGRNAVLFSHAPETMMIVAGIGAATALMAATIGLVQNDIKRVLAYSTVSQLGLMFLAMGVGAFGAGIFHLYTHAFFKALLFLGAGAVIHALHGEQDIRNMGGLRAYLPVTFWTFLVGTLAIAGVPGLAGFFSKDEILFETFREGHTVLWTVAALTSLLTATYMGRLLFLTFLGKRQHSAPPPEQQEEEEALAQTTPARAHDTHVTGDPHHRSLHDAPPAMALALVVLAIGSVAAGYIGIPHALGGSNLLGRWLMPSFSEPLPDGVAYRIAVISPEPSAATEAEAHEEVVLELTLMAVSSAIAVGGLALAWFVWARRRELADVVAARARPIYTLLLNKYYVDEIYDATVVNPIRVASEQALWRGVDVRLIDGAVNGAGAIVASAAAALRRLQTGSVRAYAGSLLIGAVLVLGYYLWR
jgi:NADH-quinone oxidoreductase subunit L